MAAAAIYTVGYGRGTSRIPFGMVFCLAVVFLLAVIPPAAAAPAAGFTASPTSGNVQLPVQFIDQSAGSPTGWAWYFGDENYTAPWSYINVNSVTARYGQSVVAMPDGSILAIGGSDGSVLYNDTWRSIDKGMTWSPVNATALWAARSGQSTVAMPDGSIVMMGGFDGISYKNGTFRSTDEGATWTRMNKNASWPSRTGQGVVALPDGNIVLMGGYDGTFLYNDTWRSTDNGVTWTEMSASAPWNAREVFTSNVLPDGSIVLIGGDGNSDGLIASGNRLACNDVWRSTDEGATWTPMTRTAGWGSRDYESSVVTPDGRIFLMGGINGLGYQNDVWVSSDKGASWKQNPAAGWTARSGQSSVVLPDGTIVVVGGSDGSGRKFDAWNLATAESTVQNPGHVYTRAGTYPVTLQVYDAGGYTRMQKGAYITVSAYPVPVVDFSADSTSGTAPLIVQFTDASANTPTGWAWYFGDENFSGSWSQLGYGPWPARQGQSAVVTPDGSLVLLGGGYNDTWRSTDRGTSWTQVTAAIPGMTARSGQSAVATPDGSIFIIGGYSNSPPQFYKNSTWRSVDNGATWTKVNGTTAPWPGRQGLGAVALPDGSIVIMGGDDGTILYNDTWRSTDNGVTWTQMTGNAPWAGRDIFGCGVLPDGSIVLIGGDGNTFANRLAYNDVWRSADKGATWTLMTSSAKWTRTDGESTVVMPDGSIVLMGGINQSGYKNDIWRSTDMGATWTPVVAHAGWTARSGQSSAVLNDGSIVLVGGTDSGGQRNDIWRLATAGSLVQNPSHTYTAAGTYQVALQATNAGGSASLRKAGYITVGGGAQNQTGNLHLSPVSTQIVAGNTARVTVILDNASAGLSGYNISVSTDNLAVGHFINVTYPSWVNMSSNSTLESGSAWFKAVDLTGGSGTRNITLLTLAVSGDAPGTMNLSVSANTVDDRSGGRYTLSTGSGQITVVGLLSFPRPGGGTFSTPTDPDNDGRYEDLDGNGWIGFNDVVVLYNNLENVGTGAYGPIGYYDYDNSGFIGFNDIVRLYTKV